MRKTPGRLRRKLASMLERELGVPVDPKDITAPEGHWRSSKHADVYRVEGWVKIGNLSWSIDSWDTMTDLVRQGFCLAREKSAGGYACGYELHAGCTCETCGGKGHLLKKRIASLVPRREDTIAVPCPDCRGHVVIDAEKRIEELVNADQGQ